jgi:putative endonuclease
MSIRVLDVIPNTREARVRNLLSLLANRGTIFWCHSESARSGGEEPAVAAKPSTAIFHICEWAHHSFRAWPTPKLMSFRIESKTRWGNCFPWRIDARRQALLRLYPRKQKSRYLCRYDGFSHARILSHKAGEGSEFTHKYRIHRLVYYEVFRGVAAAIARETEIKKWRREKKIALIAQKNPTWEDLAADWGKPAVMRVEAKAGSSPPLRAGSEWHQWTWSFEFFTEKQQQVPHRCCAQRFGMTSVWNETERETVMAVTRGCEK